MGELIIDPQGERSGSSLDELVLGQFFAQQVTVRPEYAHIEPEKLFNACWRRTGYIIKFNEPAGRALLAKLDLTGTLRGKPLAKIVAQVRQLPDDVLSVPAVMQRWARS